MARARPRCVVALGGSAGALDAFGQFFRNLPDDVEATFVVLQHMDPNQKSLLAELLSRMTSLPVSLAKNGDALRPRQVYVLEPGTILTLVGSVFMSRPNADTEERRHPIDHFFSSLAAQYGSHAIGIVVSGTGTDGTHGLRQIQRAGGRTLVQEPSEARFDGMPKSAIQAEVVDRAAPIADLARLLSQFLECAPSAVSEIDHARELDRVCEVLQRRCGHDFTAYKKSTVARRVERRLHATQAKNIEQYIQLLESDPAEPRALLRDLLISVTQFFRNEEAFEALEREVIPKLFDQSPAGDPVRIWIPACATGEEAYTIAMLLREHQRKSGNQRAVQIFATDIDRQALEVARTGLYPPSIQDQVPVPLLERYFRPHPEGFQAGQELREACIFSEHSLIKNPPFSRIDLISCRNLFIYWEPDLQQRVLPLLHYALNPAGFLFTGPAENVETPLNLFRTIDKKNRIFQKLATMGRQHVFFPLSSPGPRVGTLGDSTSRSPLSGERDAAKSLSALLLENFAPPAFILTEHGEITFFSGKTSRYLEQPTGTPSNNLFDLIHRPLRPELHALLHRAVKSRAETVHTGASFQKDGVSGMVRITVRPLEYSHDERDLYLVVLEDIAPTRNGTEVAPGASSTAENGALIQKLEEELRETREHLQSTIEEVKSSNEELLSMNEELQSANEELQTSKEELQSTNEELETVNSELSKRVEELDDTNSDLQNFFQSSQVPILFLDRDFRIQKFTSSSTRVFRLIPTDVGRPLSDIATFLDVGDLARDFTRVLESLQPIERDIRTRDGLSTYIMRVNPYRTVNNVIAGVVVTFMDVTELTRAQRARQTLAAIVESSSDAIISKDLTSIITSWNQGAHDIFGYTAEEMTGRSIKILIPAERQHEEDMILSRISRGERIHHYETERVRKDGQRVQVSISVSPVRDPAGKIVGAAKIARDITQQKKTEIELRDAVRSRDEFLSIASHELKTPLTSLTLQNQMRKRLVLRKEPSAFSLENMARIVENDERQLRRLSRLIDDMLDVARISSGRLTVNFEDTDLSMIAEEVVERFSSEAASVGCALSVDAPEAVIGHWDSFRLEQVVTNLISNALKYGPGKPVRVRVRAEKGCAILEVEDQGRGIEEADMERIFGLFERAVDDSGISGLGLGLYIVRKIVQYHDGHITAESKPGQGSRFVVTLPLRK